MRPQGNPVGVALLATILTTACGDGPAAPATAPNRAPEPALPIPDRTVHVGDTAALDLSAHFTDPDGDALGHTAESSDPSVAAVSASGSTLTVRALAQGTAAITVTASDPGGLSARQTFEVTVPNRAPEPTLPIPDRTVHVGDTAALDLSAHFTDPDGDALGHTAESSDPSVAAVSASGSTLTVRALAQGTVAITVTASDPGGLSARQTFEVTVPNRAPEPTLPIPDRTVHVGDTAALDLSAHFTDPDGDALGHTAESSDPSVAAVSASGSTLTVAALAQGTAAITVTASDPGGLSARQTFEVTVPNRAPEPTLPIPDRTVHVGDTAALDLSAHFTDPDGDALGHTAESSDPSVAAVSASGSTLTVRALAQGTAAITVTASDPGGLSARQTFEVTVPNRAPEPTLPIPDRTVHVGDTAALDLSAHFTDPDGDALGHTAESSDPSVAAVSASGSTLTVRALAQGTAAITVTASDPGGLSARQTFEVTVPNRAPEPTLPIPDRTVHVGDTAALDLSAHFTDPDGDALGHTAESSDPSVAAVSASDATLTVRALAQGTAAITVTASDPGGLSARQTFEVTVLAPGPDLTFTDTSPPSATRAPGESATFTFHVRNQGTVVSGATRIRAKRSPNPIISARDTEIASYSFAPLGAKEERAFPVTVSVDAGSAAGTIYIGLCVDAVTDESNARNNCSEGARLTIVASSAGRGRVAHDTSAIRIRASNRLAGNRERDR